MSFQIVQKKRPMPSPVQNFKTDSNVINTGGIITTSDSISSATAAAVQPPTSAGPGLTPTSSANAGISNNNAQMKQYLNQYDPEKIPEFPNLDLSLLDMPNCDAELGPTFETCYKQHCLAVVTAIGDLAFSG